MAEEYKTVKTPKGVETKFRIDADFVPQKKEEICSEFILNYCLAKGEKEWLKSVVKKEDGKYRNIAELRPIVWKKFFAQNKSIWDVLFD